VFPRLRARHRRKLNRHLIKIEDFRLRARKGSSVSYALYKHMRGPAHRTRDSAMQALGLVWGNLDAVATNLEEIRVEISRPTQYGAVLLLDHWRLRDAQGGFVVGRDVPSRELATVLRNLALYEPIEEGRDFRVRLAGTAFMRRFGRDITGLRLSEVYDGTHFEHERETLANVIRTKKPYLVDAKIKRDDHIFMRYEIVRLRVLSPDRKDSWVMGGLFYSDWA
jgi:hypothetical protein